MSDEQEEGQRVVLRTNLFCCQVCVPKYTTDSQLLEFAEEKNPCGTEHGWAIRREGSELLSGCDERVQCRDFESHCHIMLDA